MVNNGIHEDINSFLPATAYAGIGDDARKLERVQEKLLKKMEAELCRRDGIHEQHLAEVRADYERKVARLRRELEKERRKSPIRPEPPPAGPDPVTEALKEEMRMELESRDREVRDLRAQIHDLMMKTPTDIEIVTSEAYRQVKDDLEKARRDLAEARASRPENIRAERQMVTEMCQRAFATLELQTRTLVSELAALDQVGFGDIVTRLKTEPGDLKASVAMNELDIVDALREISLLADAAIARKLATPRKFQPQTKIEHRARLIIETTLRRGTLTSLIVADIIAGDEGRVPGRHEVLRAMERAEKLEPLKIEFLRSHNGGLPSQVRRKTAP